MKKLLYAAFFLLAFSVSLHAQVDNYSLKLSPAGYVQVNNMEEISQLNTYSIQFWVNPSVWTPGAAIFTSGANDASFSAALGNSEGELTFTAGANSISIQSSAIGVNKWAQITFVNSGANQEVWVNNTSIQTPTTNFTIPALSEPFFLGKNFSGRMDEFRLWNVALTQNDFMWRNTLNKYHPQWDNLVTYYKFDQYQCANLVDYKFKHHGIFSDTGASREKVSDNSLFKYRISAAYTDFNRFADRNIDKEKYLLTNDLIVLGLNTNANGDLLVPYPDNQGTVTNGSYLAEYKGRTGVLSLNGEGAKMDVGADALIPSGNYYNFQTWIYLEEWTPGAYIFKKETDDQHGFSIRLSETVNQIIVRLNGVEYKRVIRPDHVPSTVGAWWHMAVMTKDLTIPARNYMFVFNGIASYAPTSTAPSTSPSTFIPDVPAATTAVIGENLKGKLDETAIWHRNFSDADMQGFMNNGLPMPGMGYAVQAADYLQTMNSCWNYDNADNVGYDSYSYKHFVSIMRGYYAGYSGYKIRMSVGGGGETAWGTAISNPVSRTRLAKNIARVVVDFDGIDIDFEWCYDGTCFNNYGLFMKEVREYLPEGKIFTVTPHAVSYKYPSEYFQYVDYFLFQVYGPQAIYFKWNNFVNAATSFVNWGFPKDKIVLSFATTTSRAYTDAQGNTTPTGSPIGVRNGLLDGSYTPDMNVVQDTQGNYRFITGYDQTFNRSNYVQDNDLGGIFYWDMGNDVVTTHPYSLAKASGYAISSNVDTLVTHVDVNTGLTEKRISNKINVYPNPASSHINFSLPDSEEIRRANIYDTTGKSVMTVESMIDNRLNISAIDSGMFILNVNTKSGKNYVSTFIKK